MSNSFHVACKCGQVMTGARQMRHQVLTCPRCQGLVFVLPLTPWGAGTAVVRFPRNRRWWRGILALGLFIVAGGLVWAFFDFFSPNSSTRESATFTNPEGREERVRHLLNQGRLHLALVELRKGGLESNEWRHLERQLALMTDLAAEPLEEILQHAAEMNGEEWQQEFRRRYQGKALILEAIFYRGAGGMIQCDYPLLLGGRPVRWSWENQSFHRQIPETGSIRIIVGLRLKEILLDPPGPFWRVSWEPGGDTLLTDRALALLHCPEWTGPDYQELFRRQLEWVEKRGRQVFPPENKKIK